MSGGGPEPRGDERPPGPNQPDSCPTNGGPSQTAGSILRGRHPHMHRATSFSLGIDGVGADGCDGELSVAEPFRDGVEGAAGGDGDKPEAVTFGL